MAQLAIKGHGIRGKEVIEILEMLGGKNIHNYNGTFNECYVIDNDKICTIYTSVAQIDGFVIFTLEEFLERFPYKVGDKVQHKGATSCGSVFEVEKMRWVDEHVEYTVKRLWYHNGYSVVTAKDLQPFEEETMDKVVFDANAQCCDIMNHLIKKETMEENLEQITLDIPDGYEFFGIDDNNKVVFTKKQPQLPKTYAECCDILSIPPYYNLRYHTYEYGYGEFTTIDKLCSLQDKLNTLGKLLICRDAYWKIAGEQMGLGKPWKPDWNSGDQERYGIIKLDDNGYQYTESTSFVFPTEEMRDEFYENFKELIEICKELL